MPSKNGADLRNNFYLLPKVEERRADEKKKKKLAVVVSNTETDLRPAENFAFSSQILTNGSPSVYLLSAVEKDSPIPELHCFDVGKPSGSHVKRCHKFAILFGFTGSGKSTLINGMINHVLGVQWADPFRFCLAKTWNTANQASNHTSPITAYTIHHVQGMRIDYDLTIIDTPSYGGTEGLEQDREVARIIVRYLNHQQRQPGSHSIDAVCFVTNSTESTLTPAQKYGLESAVSLFGRDIAGSFRLLVTIADEMMPPVLDAMKTLNLGQEKGGKIQLPKNDGGHPFGKIYWDLCTSHLEKFFSTLAAMPAQSLQQIARIFETRQNLERSLAEIDRQSKIAWERRENINLLKQQIAQVNKIVKANKDYKVTSWECTLVQVPCDPSKMAFNCANCKETCGEHHHSWFLSLQNKCGLIYCQNESCFCENARHDLEPFRWVERQVQSTVTDQAMKEELDRSLARKSSIQEMVRSIEQELKAAKEKGVAVMRELADCIKFLESSALSFKKSTVTDLVSGMKTRNQEEKKLGWFTRNCILDELLNKSLENLNEN